MSISQNAVLNAIVGRAIGDEIQRQGAERFGSDAPATGSAAGAATSAATADPATIANFQSALDASAAAAGAGTGPVPAPAPAPLAAPDDTLGGAILRGIEQMRSQAVSDAERIRQTLTVAPGQSMTPEQLLKAHWEIRQHALELELMGKVAGKATQNLDTLLRNQ